MRSAVIENLDDYTVSELSTIACDYASEAEKSGDNQFQVWADACWTEIETRRAE